MIDADLWRKLNDEIDGSTPDICWVININTRERAIFKPNTYNNSESDNEWCTYMIAKFLNIPSARIDKGTLFGQEGCLSYDCRDLKRYRYADGYSLYRCDSYFNNKRSDTDKRVYDSPVEISFKGLLDYTNEETELRLVEMIYLDWLVRNADRHPGNYSFYINSNRVICGLMPLYDHGMCLAGSKRDVSLFPYEGLLELSHQEMLQRINQDYPQVVQHLNKSVGTPEFKQLVSDLGYKEYFSERLEVLSELEIDIQPSSVFVSKMNLERRT